MDGWIQTVLTGTSLTNFNNATTGFAVEITETEYNTLLTTIPNGNYIGMGDAYFLNKTNANSINRFSAGFTDGMWLNGSIQNPNFCVQFPINGSVISRYAYAFKVNLYRDSTTGNGSFYAKISINTGSVQKIHGNALTIVAAASDNTVYVPKYYVVKGSTQFTSVNTNGFRIGKWNGTSLLYGHGFTANPPNLGNSTYAYEPDTTSNATNMTNINQSASLVPYLQILLGTPT